MLECSCTVHWYFTLPVGLGKIIWPVMTVQICGGCGCSWSSGREVLLSHSCWSYKDTRVWPQHGSAVSTLSRCAVQWEHTSSPKGGRNIGIRGRFWSSSPEGLSWALVFLGSSRQVGEACLRAGCCEAGWEPEQWEVEARKAFYREMRENVQVGVKLKTRSVLWIVERGGWRSGTSEMPERCSSGSVLDSLVGQEGTRGESVEEMQFELIVASTSIQISKVLWNKTSRTREEPGGEGAGGCQGLVCAVSRWQGWERLGRAGAVPRLNPLFQTFSLHRVNCILFSSSLGEL